MMDVGDTSHGHEGNVVEEPTEDWVQGSVMDLINVDLFEFRVATLPANEVPEDHERNDTEGGGGSPVHERVAEEEVFYDTIIPTAHTKTDVENWPLPELRCKIILLVWIGD